MWMKGGLKQFGVQGKQRELRQDNWCTDFLVLKWIFKKYE